MLASCLAVYVYFIVLLDTIVDHFLLYFLAMIYLVCLFQSFSGLSSMVGSGGMDRVAWMMLSACFSAVL